jgi:oxygen-independent coproporphyrinogen-3 oxidase
MTNMKSSFSELLKKYDVPVPRYTSYPTVPAWTKTPEKEEWLADIRQTLSPDGSSWAMYLHIPFCETLCTFCGCNTIITKDHKKEGDYVDLLLKELDLYLTQVPDLKKRPMKHIHLGGGTPTFLRPDQLQRLLSSIFSQITRAETDFEASIEVDPRRTTYDQLKVLRELGFNRVSLGVQDFNEKVQKLINRVQPFEVTKKITDEARQLGYESVNFDLIYGLPMQDPEMMKHTLEKTIELRPDRIAFYSFALVPWIKPAQRLFSDEDLPKAEKKRELYEYARQKFIEAGYLEVGMDHFALKTDRLLKALHHKELHRNFMGYTDKRTDLLLGLGVSSISESKRMFHQNEKLLPKYQEELARLTLPTHRGHILSDRDLQQREKILQLMTQYRLPLQDKNEFKALQEIAKDFLAEGLIALNEKELLILEAGHPFLRNICAMFDEHLPQNKNQKLFSKSI